MPFKSEKQRRLFYAAANNPKVAKKTGISKEVAEKFIEDSKGKVEESKKPRFSKIMSKIKK